VADLDGAPSTVVGPCDPESVKVTDATTQRIPEGNLRVPLSDFVAVWRAAEFQNAQGRLDWYAGGVCAACRWLAGAATDDAGRIERAPSPATSRAVLAYEESIEAEYLAAQTLAKRRPSLARHQPGWCEGIAATLAWAWRGQGDRPLPDRGAGQD
jgi:hypothetical protein